MIKINLIAIGSLSNELKNVFNDYAKRIGFFSNFNLIEIKEINENNIDIKIKKETELILSKIPKNTEVILLSLLGKEMESEQFAQAIQDKNITFIIGGSNGVDESKFSNKIKFSKMTFPHQIFRIMLIEQIYRAFTIHKNIKYHK